MEGEAILDRIEALWNGFSYTAFKKGRLDVKEMKQYEKYLTEMEEKFKKGELNLIIEQIHVDVNEVSSKADMHNPDIIIVDGAYMLGEEDGDDDWQSQIKTFRGLKKLARRIKKPILASTQSKDENPTLKSISFSQNIRADADKIVGLGQTPEQRLAKEIEIVNLKNREGVSNGKILTNWDFDEMDYSTICYINEQGDRPSTDKTENEDMLYNDTIMVDDTSKESVIN